MALTPPPGTGRVLVRAVAAVAVLFALMSGLGLLLTKVVEDQWPLTEEDEVAAALEAGRTATGNDVTYWVSWAGNTGTIIAVMVVIAGLMRWTYGRWRESVFVVLAVSTQALVFLLTTLVIDRERPDVAQLDESPPTSSFPSGHTGAATALYLSTAVVLVWHARHLWARALLVALLLAVPLAVAYARLYRGMHHPSDVVGSFVNGGLSVATAARTVLFAAMPRRLADALGGESAGRRLPERTT